MPRRRAEPVVQHQSAVPVNPIEQPIDKLVKDAYSEYAKFVNCGGRTVCDEKDSLKLVQRRILYAAYTIGKTCNFKYTKTATVVGETIGKYNPHGDAACAGALYVMVNDGLMDGKGNCGSTIGIEPIEPAAMRYTECRVPQNIRDMCFKYIDDVPYVLNDLGFQEPAYIPTPLPLNLCHFTNYETWTSGIGFSLAFTLPKFDIHDLYKYLEALITKKPFDEPIHLCYRTINEPASEQLLTTGQDIVQMKGKYFIKDSGKMMVITEFPPMKASIQGTLDKFDAVPTDLSKDGTYIELSFGRGANANNYDCEKILTGKQSVDMYFCKDGSRIKHYSLKDIILTTYSFYRLAVDNNLQKRYNRCTERIENLKLMIQMKPYLNPLNDKTADKVSKGLNISMTKTNELLKNSIKSICSADTTLLEVEKELKDIEKKRKRLDKFCLSEIASSIN